MPRTLVLQSHRTPLPEAWLERCLDSVKRWSDLQGFDYRFIGDELFDGISVEIMDKTRSQRVIATDLGRLLRLREGLVEGYDCAVWLDADVFVIDVENFTLPQEKAALGREVWIQHDERGRLKSYRKVHNAFLMFRQGNSLLDFYIETATRLLNELDGPVPPQFIGPKLLTALHNICRFTVLETAGMLSPAVLQDLLTGDNEALDFFREQTPALPKAVNLCSSLAAKSGLDDSKMNSILDQLQNGRLG